MCILIAKPAGVEKPSKEIMKNCWDNNPDGAGIAWSDGRKLFLRKGMMKWSDFEKTYDELELKNAPAIIHFRIATHGTVKPENTHPFNVNESVIAAHNGVLTVKNEGDWTDSETFFKRICAPILKSYSIESKEFQLCVQALIGTSKLAFITERGKIITYGHFNEHEKVLYSNLSYEKKKPYYDYNYNYGGRGSYGSGFHGNTMSNYVKKNVGKLNWDATKEYVNMYLDKLEDDYEIVSVTTPRKVRSKSTGVLFTGDWSIANLIMSTLDSLEDQVATFAEAAGWNNATSIANIMEDTDVYDDCIVMLKSHLSASKLKKEKSAIELFESWLDDAIESLELYREEEKAQSENTDADYLTEAISDISMETYELLKKHTEVEHEIWYDSKVCLNAAENAIAEIYEIYGNNVEADDSEETVGLDVMLKELRELTVNIRVNNI